MHFEIHHGKHTHFVESGNIYAACIEVLKNESDENIIIGPFYVQNLDSGCETVVGMATVINVMILNGDYRDEKRQKNQ